MFIDFPSLNQAWQLLDEANLMNPGVWYKHSLFAAAAAKNIATKTEMLNPEKAEVLGMLHDIGRRFGVTHIKHTVDGYKFCQHLGYGSAAKICLTHSFPTRNIKEYFGAIDCSKESYSFLKSFIENTEYDDYDKLIQLCDTLALPSGFCLLEKRMVDVALRYGVNEYIIPKWKAVFKIKNYFEENINCSIYSLLPGVEKNTFESK